MTDKKTNKIATDIKATIIVVWKFDPTSTVSQNELAIIKQNIKEITDQLERKYPITFPAAQSEDIRQINKAYEGGKQNETCRLPESLH